MKRLSSVLMVASLGSFGCESPVAVESDLLQVRSDLTALEITNVSATPVYYFAAEQGTLALIDWMLCVDPARCPSIAPNAAQRVAYSTITGYTDTAHAIVVFHWRLVPGNGESGYVADSLRSLMVHIH